MTLKSWFKKHKPALPKSGRVPSSFLNRFVSKLELVPLDKLEHAMQDTRKELLATDLFQDVSILADQQKQSRTIFVSAIEKTPPKYKFKVNSSVESKSLRPIFGGSALFGLAPGKSLSSKVDYISPGVGGPSSSSASGFRFSICYEDRFLFGRDLPLNISGGRLSESIEWLHASHKSNELEVNLHVPKWRQDFGLHLGYHHILPVSNEHVSLPDANTTLYLRSWLMVLRHSLTLFKSASQYVHPDKLPPTSIGLRVDHELGVPPGLPYLRAFATTEANVRFLSKLWYHKYNPLKIIIPSSPLLAVSAVLGALYAPSSKGTTFLYAPTLFLLGGPGSLRGFKPHSLGPGTRIFSYTARLVVPWRSSPVFLQAFSNTGAVSNSYAALPGDAVSSMGVGLAYPTSSGQFEVNLCKPVGHRGLDKSVMFEFGGSMAIL
ncbi:hypothetical protein RCL1_000727 [Eukaryota sp. TZLM3-RCL]